MKREMLTLGASTYIDILALYNFVNSWNLSDFKYGEVSTLDSADGKVLTFIASVDDESPLRR